MNTGISMANNQPAQLTYQAEQKALYLSGKWCWSSINEQALKNTLNQYAQYSVEVIDATKIEYLDTSGSFFLQTICQKWQISLSQLKASAQHLRLFNSTTEQIESLQQANKKDMPSVRKGYADKIYALGESAENYSKALKDFIGFLGQIVVNFFQFSDFPLKKRIKLISQVVFEAGYKAIGIISLLSFLIGVILCYQAGLQLAQYGASIFVVDLTGMALLREFAPLVAAIIVAGRSGSAFTAEIGTQKVQQEIDALQTFGVNPIKRLVLPRVTGMMISLPLITLVANIASVIGAMTMAYAFLDITPASFLARFQSSVGIDQYLLGLIKTPFFAFIIACTGCYRGLQVQHDAFSIGQETTKSVVYSIFLIIIADGLFSILFSTVGL